MRYRKSYIPHKGTFTPTYFFQKKREATFFLCFKSVFVPYNEWYKRASKAQEESSFSLFLEKISWRERTLTLEQAEKREHKTPPLYLEIIKKSWKSLNQKIHRNHRDHASLYSLYAVFSVT